MVVSRGAAARLIDGVVALIGRRNAWRIGRRLYLSARGEPVNDMDSNGEVDLMRAALSLAERDRPIRVWDVGGNLGEWTDRFLECAASRNQSVRIEIFEPAPTAFAGLEKHFAGNESVRVNRLALSSRRGTAQFELVGPTAGTNSLNLTGDGAFDVIDVPVDTAADRIEQSGDGDPDFVKIDAEGHDLDVLLGMEPLLAAGRIGIVQFEYNWRWLINGSSLRLLFALANRVDYRVGRVFGEKVEFFEDWNIELDRFVECNFLIARPDVAARMDHRVSGWDNSNLPVSRPNLVADHETRVR